MSPTTTENSKSRKARRTGFDRIRLLSAYTVSLLDSLKSPQQILYVFSSERPLISLQPSNSFPSRDGLLTIRQCIRQQHFSTHRYWSSSSKRYRVYVRLRLSVSSLLARILRYHPAVIQTQFCTSGEKSDRDRSDKLESS